MYDPLVPQGPTSHILTSTEAPEPFNRPNRKQAWVKATVVVAFLQAAFTTLNILTLSGIEELVVDYDRLWSSLGLIVEMFLFFAFGIAVLRKRLWGAYALVGLTSIELIAKIYLGVNPWVQLLFVAICMRGAWCLFTSDNLSPTFKTLNWKTIGLFGLLVYGAGYLTGFVYGFMGFREVMGTMPTYWLTALGLMTLIFWQAGMRGLPWALETTLATGILASLIALALDLPFHMYQGKSWAEAFEFWLSSGLFTIGAATLGWGFSSLWRPASRRSEQTSTNYLARHWRGELSLVKTFWVNNFCVNVIFAFAIRWAEYSQLSEESPLLYIRILLGVLFIEIPVWIWQLVGLWRASQNHIRNAGHFFWPRIAQGIVVLSIIVFLAVIPALIESGKIALNLDEIKGYTITLTPNESEVIIEGHIAFGITVELEKELSSATTVWLVHLNSDGGYTAEGKRLHALIKERQLATYTQTGCYSACTDAFIAGKERILKESAQLGFHGSSFPGLPYQWFKDEDEKMKQHWLEAGINEEFVEKAFSVSGDDMWFPTLQELIDAGVITHTYNGTTFTDRRL